MKGIAVKAFARGMNVVRLNQRNCGDTEHLSAGLFHSGLTADPKVRGGGTDRGGRPAVDRRGRIFAGRQPRPEAGRRVRRRRAAADSLVRGGVANPRDQPVRPRAGAPGERSLRVELRARPEAPHEAQRPAAARSVRPQPVTANPHGARIRRGLYRALLRLRRRRGLLPPRERDAGHRPHPPADPHHHVRRRPVRPLAALPRSQGDRKFTHHPAHLQPRRPLRVRRPAEWRRRRWVLGGEVRSWNSP